MIPRRLEGDTILEEGGIEAQLGFPRALRADVGVAYAARQEAGQAGGRAGYLGPDGIDRAWGARRPAERAAQLDVTHARGPDRLVGNHVRPADLRVGLQDELLAERPVTVEPDPASQE